MSDHQLPERVERPIRPNLTLRTHVDWSSLGLPTARNEALVTVREMLLANLCLAQMEAPGSAVHYSRDDAHYPRFRGFVPAAYTRRNVVAVADELERSGLVHHQRTSPSAHATRRSTLELVRPHADCGIATVSDLRFWIPNPLILKDATGHQILYRDSRKLRSIRADVLEQNEVLHRIKIDLKCPVWELDRVGLYRFRGEVELARTVNPMFVDLYRVFNNGDWAQGGRWYGGWWQQLPRSSRGHLLLNGQQVCEEDYAACHLRLMCAIAGVPVPADDPYRIAAMEDAMQDPGSARRLTKISFQILVNAETSAAAHKAIAAEIGAADHVNANSVVKAIKGQFKPFARLWHRGLGLHLQRLDSDIAADVMCDLRSQSIPVLSVHDSFICSCPRPRATAGGHGPGLHGWSSQCSPPNLLIWIIKGDFVLTSGRGKGEREGGRGRDAGDLGVFDSPPRSQTVPAREVPLGRARHPITWTRRQFLSYGIYVHRYGALLA